MRLGGPIAGLTVVAALAAATPAAALPPGVYIDPGSPAGKAYSVPLSVLRGQALGHVKPGGSEPRFGVGISAAAAASSGASSKPAPRLHHRVRAARVKAPRHHAVHVRRRPARSAASGKVVAASLVSSHTTSFPVLLLAALVLLAGLILGGALRAVRRHRLD